MPIGLEIEDFREFIRYTVHQYMRELLGDAAYVGISLILLLLGFFFIFIAISNSNILLGDPLNRDKSTLSEVEYFKTRRILRIVIGVIGIILVIYNALGLLAP